MRNQFKLEMEMVPRTTWYKNLRYYLSQEEWDGIRRKTYRIYKGRCGICGVSAKMNCHEIWEFDDRKHIQKLKGFIALCKNCHLLKHLAFTEMACTKEEENELMQHFMKVNNCTEKDYKKHEKAVWKKFFKRSEFEWTVDFGIYQKRIDRAKIEYQLPLFGDDNYPRKG